MAAATLGGGAHAGRSLRFRLFVLIGAIVLAAALAFSLLIVDLYRHERAARERQLFSTAKASAAAVDADLGRGWALLDALAKSPALAAGDWRTLDAEARRMAPPDMGFVLVDPAQGPLINTRVPAEAKLPTDLGPSFKTRLARIEREGRVVSDVFVGRLVGRPTVALETMVRRPDGRNYVLSLLMDPAVQARLLARQQLPSGWIGGLLDSHGVSIARSPPIPEYVGTRGTPDMVRRIERREEGVAEATTRRGVRMVVAYARLPSEAWTVVVAAPRAEFEDAAVRGLSLALVISAAFLVGGVLLALGLSRRVLAAMDALGAQAIAVGAGEPAPAAVTGLTEADRVSRALAEAAEGRRAHERELAALNAGLEARVAEASERLVQAQKMEALGQLTGGLAHDFNNLLTAVLGNLTLLKRTHLGERQARLVDNAEAAGERGARLTGQLLAFSRRQRLAPEPLDLLVHVEDARELLTTTLGGGVRLLIRAEDGHPVVLADRTQLDLAILNLAINARDAMAGRGTLSVSAQEVTLGEAPDQEGAPPPGRYGAIVIRDSGPGMSEAVRRRIFEPFFTTKGPGQGSGLGLPQALGMARQLGGGVLVESRPGEGATVTLLLPLTAQAGRPPADRLQGQVGDLGGLKVLLVDDDDGVRAATAEMLSLLGCEVTASADGEAALAALPAALDLLVADFAMPGLNGAELAERFMALRPGVPVLLVTGYADPERVGAVWRGPVLSKPFDFDTLGDAVRHAVAQAAVA